MWSFLMGSLVMSLGILIGFALANIANDDSTQEIDNE